MSSLLRQYSIALRKRIRRLARRMVHGRVQRSADAMATAVGIPAERSPGGLHDAFIHAYVSARLTIRLGPRIAEWMGDLNEKLGSEAEGRHLEAAMDRHNNAAGREIGRRLLEEGQSSSRVVGFDPGVRGLSGTPLGGENVSQSRQQSRVPRGEFECLRDLAASRLVLFPG